MHTLKIIAATILGILLCVGSILVSIAALWGKPRRRGGRHADVDYDRKWDESIEDV